MALGSVVTFKTIELIQSCWVFVVIEKMILMDLNIVISRHQMSNNLLKFRVFIKGVCSTDHVMFGHKIEPL